MTRTRPRRSARLRASHVSDADWLQLQQGGARPRAVDSRWRRLGSEFRRSGGKGKHSAAPTAPPPPALARRRSERQNILRISLRSKAERRTLPWLSRPPLSCAAPPARLLPSPSGALRESLGGSRTAAKPPSLYLHSLPSLTRLPTPIHATVSTAPLHGQSGAVCGFAHARSGDAPGAERHLSDPPLVASPLPPSSATPISGMQDARGSRLVVNCPAGRFGQTVSPRRACLAPPPDRWRTHTRAAVQASGSLSPLSVDLAKVVFQIRCRLKPHSSSALVGS